MNEHLSGIATLYNIQSGQQYLFNSRTKIPLALLKRRRHLLKHS